MRKITFYFALLCLISIDGLSQAKAKIGIQGGGALVGNTRQSTGEYFITEILPATTPTRYLRQGRDNNFYKSFATYYGGLVFSLPLGKKSWTFRPEINYTQKGYEREYSYSDYLGNYVDRTATFKVSANCIEVPLNFVYNVSTKKGKVFLGAGPYISYIISGKQEHTYDSYLTTLDDDLEMTFADDGTAGIPVNRVDFGFNGTAGYIIKNKVFFNLSYSMGANDFRININEIDGDKFQTNRATKISFGIGFFLGK